MKDINNDIDNKYAYKRYKCKRAFFITIFERLYTARMGHEVLSIWPAVGFSWKGILLLVEIHI